MSLLKEIEVLEAAFVHNIRLRLTEMGLSEAAFAAAIGISRQAVFQRRQKASINPKSLAKLTPAYQKVYLATWRGFFVDKLVELTDEERKMQIEDFKKAGVNMYHVSPEKLAKWQEVAEKVNEEQYFKPMEKKGIDGRKIVSQFQALYKKYERK